jgi:excisionase family DNA binding protein
VAARSPGMGRLLLTDAAANYLGVLRATVERLAHRGELPIVKFGGSSRNDVGASRSVHRHERAAKSSP